MAESNIPQLSSRSSFALAAALFPQALGAEVHPEKARRIFLAALVITLVLDVVDRLGPITAVVHGAGVLADRRIADAHRDERRSQAQIEAERAGLIASLVDSARSFFRISA